MCFEAQQAVELYLKALSVKLTGLYEFTHDLSKLLKYLEDAGLKIPEQLYVYADALTPHYTLARYPGSKPIVYDEAIAKRCIDYMEKIIEWIMGEAENTN
ncbi:MAG: HEPN domain-containing protein [Thermoprotei archaeon]